MAPSMATQFNAQEVRTFVGKTISPDQMQARFEVLLERAESDTRPLSPRSTREMQDIAEIINRQHQTVITETVGVHRVETAPSYFVRFNNTNNAVERYTTLQQNLAMIPTSPVETVQAIQPQLHDSWFRQAILAQSQAVMKSDFTDALRHAFLANTHLLYCLPLLVKAPGIFRDVCCLYGTSYDLYQDQINFNRNTELLFLQNTQAAYERLTTLSSQVLHVCGPRLEDNANQIVAYCNDEVLQQEGMEEVTLNTLFAQHCEAFISKIETVRQGVQAALQAVSQRHVHVMEALRQIETIGAQMEALGRKQDEAQREFQAYQERKAREWSSQKTMVDTYTVGILGIPIFSRSQTHIQEADFHSREAYEKYLQLREEETRLKSAMEGARGELARYMAEQSLSQYGMTAQEIQMAAYSLATAITSLQRLQSVLQIRAGQARNQVAIYQVSVSENRATNLGGVLGYMNILLGKMIHKKSCWIESNRQSVALQTIREVETNLHTQLTQTMAQGAVNPETMAGIQQAVRELLPPPNREAGEANPVEAWFRRITVSDADLLRAITLS